MVSKAGDWAWADSGPRIHMDYSANLAIDHLATPAESWSALK